MLLFSIDNQILLIYNTAKMGIIATYSKVICYANQ